MKVKVVAIGNSRGIRIPKAVLEQCAISHAVNLHSNGKRIVLTPVKEKPRQGWAEAAQKMRRAGDDELLAPDVFPDEADLAW